MKRVRSLLVMLCLLAAMTFSIPARADGNSENPGITGNSENPGVTSSAAPSGFTWVVIEGVLTLVSLVP